MSHQGVEGSDAFFAAVREETIAAGRHSVVVADEAGAMEAVFLALQGHDLLIHAIAERSILDRLYDDLRRLDSVEVRTAAADREPRATLTGDESALLERLASGRTLREAAVELHLSLRTADRRLASARVKLGVATNAAALTVVANQRTGGGAAPSDRSNSSSG